MDTQLYIDAMHAKGVADAKDLQTRSASMDGTALYAEENKIPEFAAAVKTKNMLQRKAGQADGFVCRNSLGQVCRLIQAYDSDIYTQEPGSIELAAHWRFVWSTDPKKAKPFLEEAGLRSTNFYNKDECCTFNGYVWQSLIATNTYTPVEYPRGWKDLGTIESVITE